MSEMAYTTHVQAGIVEDQPVYESFLRYVCGEVWDRHIEEWVRLHSPLQPVVTLTADRPHPGWLEFTARLERKAYPLVVGSMTLHHDDQGVHLAASSLEEAKRFTDEHSPDHDGYHLWRIDELEVDAPRWPPLPKHPQTKIDNEPQDRTNVGRKRDTPDHSAP